MWNSICGNPGIGSSTSTLVIYRFSMAGLQCHCSSLLRTTGPAYDLAATQYPATRGSGRAEEGNRERGQSMNSNLASLGVIHMSGQP
jgi:hypothetical protein